jgi:hypothetical protein
MYYLIIDTDGDFGIKLAGHIIWEYARIKARSHKALVDAVMQMEFISRNPSKDQIGREFVEDLKKNIGKENGARGGNWSYDFGRIVEPKWDIIL